MRATLSGSELAAAVGWIARLVPNRPAVPALGGVLIIADDDGLRLRATDWETFGQVRAKGAVTEPGQALVSARLLGAVAKATAKAADVEITTVDGRLLVAVGRTSWTLPVIPSDEYPTFADAGAPVAEMDGADLASVLARVLPAADKEGAAPLHCGVVLTSAGDCLYVTTTDRYRLADACVPWRPVNPEAELELQLTAGLLEFASKAGGSGPVTLGATGELVSFTSSTHSVIGRQLGQELPKMRRLIPQGERPGWATVVAADLVGAINDVNAVAESALPVRLLFTEEELELTLTETSGEAVAAVALTGSGGRLPELFVKAQYLLEAVRCAGTEQVWFGFDTTPTKPVLIMPVGADGEPEPGYTHLVMGRRRPTGAQ